MENNLSKNSNKKRFMVYFNDSQYELFERLQLETNLGAQGTVHHAIKTLLDKTLPAYVRDKKEAREARAKLLAEKQKIANISPDEKAKEWCASEGGVLGLMSINNNYAMCITAWNGDGSPGVGLPLKHKLSPELLETLKAEAVARDTSKPYKCPVCPYTTRQTPYITGLRGAPVCPKDANDMIPA